MTGSNRRPPACKAGALPAELIPPTNELVGLVGFEPTTPALSRRCSNQLSYRPAHSLNSANEAPGCLITSSDKRKTRQISRAPTFTKFTHHCIFLLSTAADKCGRKKMSVFFASAALLNSILQAKSIFQKRASAFPERR